MADTSFIQKLRMKGIFGGDKPLGMPDMDSNSLDVQGMINKIYPILANEREKDRQLKRQLGGLESLDGRPIQANNLKAIADSAIGPKVNQQQLPGVIGNTMTDFQKGTLDLRRKELENKNMLNESKLEGAAEDRAIRQQRANVYEFKAKNPNMQIKTPGDGKVYAINPQTGETIDLGIDTLSDQEKLELQGSQRMSEIGARGDVQKDIETFREKAAADRQLKSGEQRLNEISARGKETRETNISRPQVATQQRAAQANAARQLINTRPDLAKFIELDESGNPTVKPTSTSRFGSHPTQQQFDEINNILYGNAEDIELEPEDKVKKNKTEDVPEGAKPGGKWINTSYGRVYQEP